MTQSVPLADEKREALKKSLEAQLKKDCESATCSAEAQAVFETNIRALLSGEPPVYPGKVGDITRVWGK
jgi:hypothetical protein